MASVLISSFLIDWLSLIRSIPSSSSTTTGTVADDLEKMARMLQRIKAVLLDAEEREITDKSVKLWLDELKDVAYDAQDVLDEYQYHVLRSQVDNRIISAETETEASMKMKGVEGAEEVTPLASTDSNIAAIKISILNSMDNRIKNIRKRFKEISKDRDHLHLKPEDGQRRSDGNSEYPQPTSHMVNDRDVYGREDEKEELTDWLLSDQESNFEVLAVVGKGGLGKTTLAQLVYNDQKVSDYFEQRMWICVSEDFNLIRLTRAMIENITEASCALSELSVLQRSLQKELKGKRVLLVLDDVWNEEKGLWESLSIPLHSAEMTRIIITTRKDSVAEIMQTTYSHRLGYLPEEQCQKLFQCHVFCGREQLPSLVEIGKKIVKKCDGLPLAVKSLGSLLRYETGIDEWQNVLHSQLWELETKILPALKLSYIRMPSRLKPCFEICSVFPKDYEFSKDELVNLWVSHGYIQGNNGEKNAVQEIGHKYFDELHRRSFFDEFFKHEEEIYKMHDNIHDLAHYVQMGMDLTNHKIRHLSIKNKSLDHYTDDIGALRTLIVMQGNNIAINDMFWRNITRLTDLRYLDLKLYKPREEFLLPDGLRNLICLRHLELNIAGNMKLPKSIGDMYNLVDLKITCLGVVELPETFRNLVSLTIIHFRGFRNDQLPALSQLPSLISLILDGFDNVKSIGNKFYRGLNNNHHVAFQSLTSLVFQELINWEKWDELRQGDFPRIQKLQINTCKKLSSLPSLRNLSSLSHMSIKDCSSLQLSSVGSFPQNLKIFENSGKLKLRLPQGFGELKQLEMVSGKVGVSIDEVFVILKNLVNLKELVLWNADDESYARFSPNGKEDLFLAVERGQNKGNHRSESDDASFSLLTNLLPETLINLVSLTTIYFHGFNIDHLPALGQLPSLKSLNLEKLENVKTIGNEFCRQGNNRHYAAFPCLTYLDFRDLPSWVKWDELKEGDFPRLQRIYIWACEKLSSIPSLENLSSLCHISLFQCDSLRLSPKGSFPPNLKTLENSHDLELSLPQGFGELKKLKMLSGIFGIRTDEVLVILKNMVSLKCLILSNLRNVDRAWNDEACLGEYSSIEKLALNWSLPSKAYISFNELHLVVERNQNNGGHKNLSLVDNLQPRAKNFEELYQTEEDNDNETAEDDSDIISEDNETSLFVLEKFRPHTNLQELYIAGYYGVGYPTWIGHPSFDRINKVHLQSCKIEQLPTLGQLPSLKHLHLHSIYRLKRIGDEFCQGINNNNDEAAFPSLIELVFEEMYHWEEWDGMRQGDFPKLESLSIYDCPRLSSLPVLRNLCTNFNLSIHNCPAINVSVEGSFPSSAKFSRYITITEAKLLKLQRLKGVFRARNDGLFQILYNLPVITEYLTITALKNIRSIMDVEANLKSKRQLEELILKWSNDNITRRDEYYSLYLVVEDGEDDRTNEIENASFFVLEKLQPHVNLLRLVIEGYNGVGYPNWIGHPSFYRLVYIELGSCNSNQLPTLGQLPSLGLLRLYSISGLKTIGDEFCRGAMINNDHNNVNVAFPSLYYLIFKDMHDWEEWYGVLDQDFPRLRRLEIENCPCLRVDSFPRKLFKYICD